MKVTYPVGAVRVDETAAVSVILLCESTEFAVVGRDGSLHLPPEVFDLLPPDSLVRVIRRPDGVDLRRADEQEWSP